MITQADLMQYLRYDPITGEFEWIVAPGHVVKAGTKAGHVDANGYNTIRFKCKDWKTGARR